MTPTTGTYVPPTEPNGSGGGEYELAPGVLGYAINEDEDGLVFIPSIVAMEEGSGAVGRFLDSLHPKCRVPNVISHRLREMLTRRGWKTYSEWHERFKEPVVVWRKSS